MCRSSLPDLITERIAVDLFALESAGNHFDTGARMGADAGTVLGGGGAEMIEENEGAGVTARRTEKSPTEAS